MTDRKRMQRALQESEERYRNLVESSPDAILVHQDWKCIYVNPAFIRLYGAASADGLIGKHVLEFLHADSHKIACKRIRESYLNGIPAPPLAEKLLRIDGTVLDIEVTAVPIPYEGKPSTLVIAHDITNWKQAEWEIRCRNNQLTIINEIIKLANTSLNLYGMLEKSLKKTLELLDFDMGWIYLKTPDGKRAELITHMGVPQSFVQNSRHLNIRDWPYNVVFYAGQPRYIENLRKHTPGLFDSRILEEIDAVAYAGVPLTADSVIVGGMYVGIRDRHKLSPMEKTTLEAIGKQIGGTILRGMLQDQLEEAYKETQSYLNILVQEFTDSTISSLERIKELKCAENGSSHVHIEGIERNLEQCAEIVKNITMLRRLSNEEMVYSTMKLDSIIKNEVEKYPNASIRYETSGIHVKADEMLSEVFANIIGNAVRYGGSGVEIWIKADERERYVTISIEDSGPGIPDDQKSNLFTSLHPNLSNPGRYGIGLYISSILIERYGGSIWVDDRIPGEPSLGLAVRFTLYLSDE